METLVTFLLAGAVTLFFVRGYLKKLTAQKQGGTTAASPQKAKKPCPRCGKPLEAGSAFCPSCGAAMSMWTVHQAETKKADSGAAATGGKPQPVINASLCIGCGSCVHACPETGTLELQGGKAILAHPERCTGHAKCIEVCPTQALSLAIGGVLQTVRVPNVNPNFETNLPGVFIIGELSGFGLIKTAINEGKLVIDHLRSKIGDHQAEGDSFDVAIVGAGPAGLSASLTAQQYGLKYVTLEQGEIAATIRQYPRQKFLMAEPIEIPLYGTLYVGDGTKESLLSVWETIINNTGVKIRTNERVERIQKNGTGYYLATPSGEYHAKYVILALGRRGTPKRLGVPGEDLAKVSFRLIEADTYDDNDILVIGGGDSAVEAALALSRGGKNRVTLAHRRAAFERVRQRNAEFLSDAEKKGEIKVLRNAQLQEIRPTDVAINVDGSPTVIPNDFAFILIGGTSPEEFLRKTGVEIVEKVITA